jgi:aryl-alcohol dehydrogenase-like predicted oxidoreductase
MTKLTRRKFIGTMAAAGLAGAGGCVPSAESAGAPAAPPLPFAIDPAIKSPADRVPLGRSGVRASVVGVGTGSVGWGGSSNQTRLGQEAFTRLMRHALDGGVTLYDLADQYGSNPYFARAMEGVPRDRYVIQTKTNSRDASRARADVDRFLRELKTDYIDSLLVHCVTEADWPTRFRGVLDALEEAREKGKIRAHGVTCHSFEALRAAEASDWVQINQVRWNPKASHMDADVETARALFAKMRGRGQGMIGMKVVGQGDLVSGRRVLTPDECFRFQIESGVVDAFVVGVESVDHVDRLLDGTRLALAEVGYRAALA